MARKSPGPSQSQAPEKRLRPVEKRKRALQQKGPHDELGEVLAVAQQRGLLSGSRTHVNCGRMPVALVEQAKRSSGIASDSKLLQAALANFAVADYYAQWLLAQRGTVSAELDLEF
jgi:hypothetical protein